MQNQNDELVLDALELLEDLGVDSIDDAPYDVLCELGTYRGCYISQEDILDFAERAFG